MSYPLATSSTDAMPRNELIEQSNPCFRSVNIFVVQLSSAPKSGNKTTSLPRSGFMMLQEPSKGSLNLRLPKPYRESR